MTGNKRTARRFRFKLAAQAVIGGVLLAAAVRTYEPDWVHRIEGAVGTVMLLDVPYEYWLNFTGRGGKRLDAKMLRRYRRAGTLEGLEELLGLLSLPKRAAVINRLGSALESSGDADRAEIVYRRAAELGDASAMANVARMHYRRGEQGPALLWCQRAFDGGLDVPRLLGELLHSKGETAAAIDAYRRALKAGDQTLRATLGDLLMDNGALAEGEALLRAAVTDGDPVAMNSLGRQLLKQGASAEAETLFEQAAREEPYGLFNLAKIRLDQHAFDEAEALLRRSLDAGHVDQAILALDLAYLAAERSDAAAAERMYRRAVDAGSTTAVWKLGDMLRRRGDLDGAEKLYQRGPQMGDHHASTEYVRLVELRATSHGGPEAMPSSDSFFSSSFVPEVEDGDRG